MAVLIEASNADKIEYMCGDENARLFALLRQPPTHRTRNAVAELITAGDNVKWRGNHGETFLHLLPSCALLGSAIAGQTHGDKSPTGINRAVDYLLPVVYQLVAAGLNADTAVDRYGNTPLHVCVVNGAGHRMARALLRVGVDPEKVNRDGKTAVRLARGIAGRSKSAAARVARTVLGVIDEAGCGLWSAVMQGDEALARRLVQFRYRVDLHRDGQTLSTVARQKSVSIELRQLIDGGGTAVRLAHAALAGDVATVCEMLNVAKRRPELPNPNPNARDPGYRFDDGSPIPDKNYGWPLVAEVVRLGLRDVALALVEMGNVDVNAKISVDSRGRPVPVFQWAVVQLLDNYASTDYRPPKGVLVKLIPRADLSLIVDPATFIQCLHQRRSLPMSEDRSRTSDGQWSTADEFLLAIISRQVSLLSRRDADGRTARDLIMLDALKAAGNSPVATTNGDPIEKTGRSLTSGWKTAVQYIDIFIVELVRRQSIDKLETLASDGYDYINVDDVVDMASASGQCSATRSMLRVACDERFTGSMKFLKELAEYQKKVRRLHQAIARGHLADVRQNVDLSLMRARDIHGRRALHIAVIYVRRLIISELIAICPDAVNFTDYKNRTALHYAHCIQFGDDIIDGLVESGADTQVADQDGLTPGDFSSNPALRTSTWEAERSRQSLVSSEAFLVERYLSMSDAISSRRCQRLNELCDTLFDADELNRMSPKSCKLMADLVERHLVNYRPLLLQCVDHDLEDSAVHLIQHGADYAIESYPLNENFNCGPVDLLNAANDKSMYKLVECIKDKMSRVTHQKVQPVVHKEVVPVIINPPTSDVIDKSDHETHRDRDTNVSFSIYNLRPTASPTSGLGRPRDQTERSSSPVCLIL